MDVDRRYYNRNTGSAADNFANINLSPATSGSTGSRRSTSCGTATPTRTSTASPGSRSSYAPSASRSARTSRRSACRRLVNAITRNIEVAEGGRKLQGGQVLNTRCSPTGCPSGHLFQDRIENVVCSLGCQASADDIQKAVQTFTNPDVESSKDANAAALGTRSRRRLRRLRR